MFYWLEWSGLWQEWNDDSGQNENSGFLVETKDWG